MTRIQSGSLAKKIGRIMLTLVSIFLFQQETKYAQSHADLPVRLFIGVGELEEIAYPVEEFTQVLDGRNYAGLEMEF